MLKIIPQTIWAYDLVVDFARSISWADLLLVVGFILIAVLFAAVPGVFWGVLFGTVMWAVIIMLAVITIRSCGE
jgi:hypothetical protein